MSRSSIINSALILLLLISFWLLRSSQDEAQTSTQEEHVIDYMLRDLSTTTFGQDGKPHRTLNTPELKHYQDDDTSELLAPHIVAHQGAQPPWNIYSDTGWVSGDGELILLNGKVKMRREAFADNPSMNVDTKNLRVRPNEDYAETEERVKVRSSNGDRVDGVGAQVWLAEPMRLLLKSNSKAHYATKKP